MTHVTTAKISKIKLEKIRKPQWECRTFAPRNGDTKIVFHGENPSRPPTRKISPADEIKTQSLKGGKIAPPKG